MKTELDKSQLEAARIFGINDFNKGIKCIPSLSKSCMSLLEVNRHVKGATLAIMKSWVNGWTYANLSS